MLANIVQRWHCCVSLSLLCQSVLEQPFTSLPAPTCGGGEHLNMYMSPLTADRVSVGYTFMIMAIFYCYMSSIEYI